MNQNIIAEGILLSYKKYTLRQGVLSVARNREDKWVGRYNNSENLYSPDNILQNTESNNWLNYKLKLKIPKSYWKFLKRLSQKLIYPADEKTAIP